MIRQWYVVHNIHGKVHIDPFTSIQGGRKAYEVTGIYAPRSNNWFNRGITKIGLADGGYLEPINIFDGKERSIMYRAPQRTGEYSVKHYQTVMPSDNTDNVVRPQVQTKAVVKAKSPQERSKTQAKIKKVQPDKQQVLKQYEEVIPDEQLRNGLITYINDNLQDTDTVGAYQRMLDVFNTGVNPPSFAFNNYTDGRAATLTPYVVTSHIHEKLPFSGLAALAATVPDILIRRGMDPYSTGQRMFDELGHWWQYNPNINNGHRFSENDNWSLLTGNFTDAVMEHSGKSSYGTPGAFEHSAHLGHDAVLGSYVFNTTPEHYLKHIAPPVYWHKDKDRNWYEQNRSMYQDTIKSIPQAIQYSDLISKSMANYGQTQYDAYWNDPALGTQRRLDALHGYGW